MQTHRIQHVTSEASVSSTRVASRKCEQAKPRDFLLNEVKQKLFTCLPPTFCWAELSVTATPCSREGLRFDFQLGSRVPSSTPLQWKEEKDGWERGVSYHSHHICKHVHHRYLNLKTQLGIECCLVFGISI